MAKPKSKIDLATRVLMENHNDASPVCRVVITSLDNVTLLCDSPEDLSVSGDMTYNSETETVICGEISIPVKRDLENLNL